MNGGDGLRLTRLVSIVLTDKSAALILASASLAAVSLDIPNLPSFSPSIWVRRAVNWRPSALAISVFRLQYSSAVKASISASRSQIRRRATDCTRPADFDPGNLRHNTGEIEKPTR